MFVEEVRTMQPKTPGRCDRCTRPVNERICTPGHVFQQPEPVVKHGSFFGGLSYLDFTGPELDQLLRVLESAWMRAESFGIPAAELRRLAGKVRQLIGGRDAEK